MEILGVRQDDLDLVGLHRLASFAAAEVGVHEVQVGDADALAGLRRMDSYNFV